MQQSYQIVMAMVRCSKRLSVTRSKKNLAQSRQVNMKAKSTLVKRKRQLSPNARAVAMRQLPTRRKRLDPVQPSVRPQTAHNYSLRSRSSRDEEKDSANECLKSLSSSTDSGIESAANTSDSEDSNASASEASDSAASFSSASRVVSSTHTKISIDLVTTSLENGSRKELEYSFSSVTTNFLSLATDEMPEFLQDIDEVIKADAPSEVTHISSSSSCSVQELALCAETLGDSSMSLDSCPLPNILEQVKYGYTASASELEFVIEIFRGANQNTPARRLPAQLPPKTRSCPKYTLVLDLDETLVHCFTNEPPSKYDYSFSVEVPDTSGSGESTQLAVFARLRPFVREFLEKVSRKFEVMVFTASVKNYSSKMLDLLDPEGNFIKHRFYRDHCVPVGCGSFVKDLSIFTRDLSRLIIVDNQIASFAFHIDNGIPIRSWIGDDNDRDLLHLADFLETLADSQQDLDVRHFIRESLKISNQLHSHMEMYYSHFISAPQFAAPASPSPSPTPPPTTTSLSCK